MTSTHRTDDRQSLPIVWDLKGARLRAVRNEPEHRRIAQGGGVDAGPTGASPFIIRFSFSSAERMPPPLAGGENDGSYIIESFGLQRDLETLLMWAQDESVQLQGLSAGPRRVADALCSQGSEHAVPDGRGRPSELADLDARRYDSYRQNMSPCREVVIAPAPEVANGHPEFATAVPRVRRIDRRDPCVVSPN